MMDWILVVVILTAQGHIEGGQSDPMPQDRCEALRVIQQARLSELHPRALAMCWQQK